MSYAVKEIVGVDGPGGGRFASPEALAKAIAAAWPSSEAASRFVVCTGGEPLLQLDAPLIESLHAEGFGLPFTHFFLQPMDGPDRLRNTQLAVQYCLEHPRWCLSLQTHKLLGIP
jgi:organic radical activating enzyme